MEIIPPSAVLADHASSHVDDHYKVPATNVAEVDSEKSVPPDSNQNARRFPFYVFPADGTVAICPKKIYPYALKPSNGSKFWVPPFSTGDWALVSVHTIESITR